MSYCIGYIVSEASEVQIITQEVFPREVSKGEILVQSIRPGEAADAAKALVRAGAQLLVARGGNFQNLQQLDLDVPSVELVMRTTHVLRAIGDRLSGYEQVWLVLSQFVRFDFESCRPLLPPNVHCFQYGPVDEMLKFIAQLDAPSNTLIVGSGFTLAPARARGFDAVQIRNDPQAIRESYAEALNLLQERDKEAAKARQIDTILSNIEDGVVVLDNKGGVVLCNQKGEELLGLSLPQMKRSPLYSSLPELAPVWEAYRQHKTSERLVRTSNHTLSAKMQSIIDLSTGMPEGGILLTLRDVTKLQRLEQNLRFQLSKKGHTAHYHFEDIRTKEPSMQALVQGAKSCAQTDNTVIIYGQSGTGKELLAQSIHNHSNRRDNPFVAVNCAALSESLLESELFGYVGGAYTGARKEGKAGLFELAHRGTIFLDEINSMSLSTQSKILRVIEAREVMRLGSDYIIPLDVRIIAATNDDLVSMVKKGQFRRDLFFRLNVLELHIPTLNERPKDIPYLFQLFVAELLSCPAKEVPLSPALKKALLSHNWWGNVRELRNIAQKYVVLGEEASIAALSGGASNAPAALLNDDFRVDLKALDRMVEDLVINSLLDKGLTKTQTAKALGISRTALFKKMEAHKQRENEDG